MTKVKLANGTVVNASDVVLAGGVLKITTTDSTVEKLAKLFSDKENTNLITLLTEADVECAYKTGFTSFAGINYDSEGVKTVELFQPIDASEERISNAEGAANLANEGVAQANENISELEGTINALLGTEVTANEE